MEYFDKVAGVTFEGRQRVIRILRPGDLLTFVHEKDNPYDSNAVAIFTQSGLSVGYLRKGFNAEVADNLDHGVKYKVTVSSITGGGFDQTYGVNIKIETL